MIKDDIDYREELEYVPYHKTGIKILDKSQLKNLFPNYESFLMRIEEHRQKLQKLEHTVFEKNNQYNLMYDNIFAIFGKRGAGKTSAMFTLKRILETSNKKDLVLPIVMPEMIPQECSMIGWILSLLEEIVNELDQKMQNNYKMDYTDYKECMYRSQDSLKREYEKVKELCFSQFYQAEGTESFSTVLINKEKQTQNSFDFSKRLGEFWNTLKKVIQKTSSDKTKSEPLIYIIFDDVDLLPEAVTTLLSTIIKYLSHPNIIVFVTADEELLYDVIENNMNENLGKYKELEMYSHVARTFSDADYNRKYRTYYLEMEQKLQRARQIPRLYVDKVLPPSSRYYLKSYENYEDKSMFIEKVVKKEIRGKEVNVSVELQEVFKEEINRYVKAIGLSEERDNFLIDQGRFIKAYFAFWGNTSRQLVNEALILHEFITRLISTDKSYKEGKYSEEKYLNILYEYIYDFAYNSLVAMGNSEMSVEEIKALLEELIVCKTGNWGIYFNYSYLREQAEEIVPGNNFEKRIQQIICLSILLFFLESILILESKSKVGIAENRREKIHGRGILVDILDYVTATGESLVCKNQAGGIKGFLLFYEKLLLSPETLTGFNLMEPRKVRGYLNKLSLEEKCVELQKYSRENPKWLKSIAKILYFSNEGMYEIRKSEVMLRKLNNPTHVISDVYFENSLREIRADLITVLSTLWKKDVNHGETPVLIGAQEVRRIIRDSAEILDKIKNEKRKQSDLKTIEEEVLQRISKYLGDKKEWEWGMAYKRAMERTMGIKTRTVALMEELEDISNRILDNYSFFTYYRIQDTHKFKELLEKLKLYDIAFSQSLREIKDEILVSDLHKILRYITNEVSRTKLLHKYESTFLYYDNMKNPIELEAIYDELCNSVSLAMKNEEDVKHAINIIIDTQQFQYLQKLYIWSYLEVKKAQPKDMRIDCTSIPHQNLYLQICEEMQRNSYLSRLLYKEIEHVVSQYVDMLMKG